MNASASTTLARAAHDAGLAALLGGNLFGRLAMHPALESVSDKSERGAVLNRAWRRYGTVNSISLAAVIGGWALTRAADAPSARERALARARDAAVAAVALTGLACAAEGVRFARSAPGGAVPLQSGDEPAPETPRRAARTKRVLSALGRANAISELALVAINAATGPERRRRPRLPHFGLG